MFITAYPRQLPQRIAQTKILRVMKLTTLFLLAATLQVAASADAQQVSIRGKNLTLKSIFKAIRNQTGYVAIYEEQLIEKAKPVTLEEKTLDLKTLLDKCFANQSLTYTIREQAIIVKAKEEKKEPAAEEAVINMVLPEKPEPPPTIDIRGIVKNERGEPVEGATVAVKGSTTKRTSTNAQGEFSLSGVDDKATLVISAVTIETLEVAVKNRVFIAIEVVNKVNDLDETVVVAYNTSTKRSNVGAVTVVKGEEIQNLPNRSVDRSLQGLVPGLLVTPGTGQPGGGVSNFVLRGIATGTGEILSSLSTIRNPLIVVDGVPVFQDPQIPGGRSTSISDVPINNPMAQLNPSDIESISVLKDAAAIALYGSNASNGVILITTKRGTSGKTILNFRSQFDIASRVNTDINLVNQEEYLELLYETFRNTSPGISDAAIANELKLQFPTKADGSFYPFTDLAPLLYNNAALTASNELAISGGNDRSTFYTNFEWTKQDGVYKKTGFDRKTFRLNFDNRIRDWLKVAINNSLSYNVQDYAYGNTAQYGSIFYSYPLNPVYLENGEYYLNYKVPANEVNPVGALEYNSSFSKSYRGLTSIFVEINFLKDLKFTSKLGTDFLLTESKERMDPRLVDPESNQVGLGRIYEAKIRNANLINTNMLNFSKTFFSHHNVSILVGQEARLVSKKTVRTMGTSFPYYVNRIESASKVEGGGGEEKQTGLSYFGQLNYGFKSKYFVTATIRADGYSQFGEKQPFNTYWSLGTGWIVSDEKLMKNAAHWLDYLKVRGSFGPAGNAAAIGKYSKYQQLFSVNFLNPSVFAILPSISSVPSNPLIKPERTTIWDAGLELKAWNNRIGITADVYWRKTTDLIFEIPLPTNSGFLSVKDNLGDMVNKGIEISLAVNIIKSKGFAWNVNANWSTNQNKLVKANSRLPATVGGVSGLANGEGRSFNSFYMRKWAGVDPLTGQGMWIDSTGKPNVNYNAALPQWVGKPQPDGFGALTNTFNIKDISFSFQLYYQYGFQVYNDDPKLMNDGFSLYDNQEKAALNRWQKPGDVAANPKRLRDNPIYSRTSTRNLFDGDYIRLQNVMLAYKLPMSFVKQLHISSLRIFAQGYNLALWSTKRPGTQDISNVNVQGQLAFQYPITRSFSFGVNASF